MRGTLQLISRSGKTIQRRRFGDTGVYVDGRYVASPTIDTLDIQASVQPLPSKHSKTIVDALDGAKLTDIIIIFCAVNTLQTADHKTNTKADHVVFEGEVYEVKRVTHRTGLRLRHDDVLAVRLSS